MDQIIKNIIIVKPSGTVQIRNGLLPHQEQKNENKRRRTLSGFEVAATMALIAYANRCPCGYFQRLCLNFTTCSFKFTEMENRINDTLKLSKIVIGRAVPREYKNNSALAVCDDFMFAFFYVDREIGTRRNKKRTEPCFSIFTLPLIN